MGWVLRLVESGTDGSSGSVDVLEINETVKTLGSPALCVEGMARGYWCHLAWSDI